jgi:hypothetical protein
MFGQIDDIRFNDANKEAAMLRKGQMVTYRVRKSTVRAIVRTVHKNGMVTVEATHELRSGKPYGCYMGYRYRMHPTDLRAT